MSIAADSWDNFFIIYKYLETVWEYWYFSRYAYPYDCTWIFLKCFTRLPTRPLPTFIVLIMTHTLTILLSRNVLLFSDSRFAWPVLFSYDIPVYMQFILNRPTGKRPVVRPAALTDTGYIILYLLQYILISRVSLNSRDTQTAGQMCTALKNCSTRELF